MSGFYSNWQLGHGFFAWQFVRNLSAGVNDAEVTLVLLMSASLASERGDFPVADQRLISGRDGLGSPRLDGKTYRQTLTLVPSCTTTKRRTV